MPNNNLNCFFVHCVTYYDNNCLIIFVIRFEKKINQRKLVIVNIISDKIQVYLVICFNANYEIAFVLIKFLRRSIYIQINLF